MCIVTLQQAVIEGAAQEVIELHEGQIPGW